MSSGLPAGLLSADQLQEMLDKRKRKRDEHNKGYETGANAEIVHRDKYGEYCGARSFAGLTRSNVN